MARFTDAAGWPVRPRYIGDQDVFVLQDNVIEHILAADREAEAKAAAPIAVDPIQQTVSEEIKDAMRRRTVDREKAKVCINFLGQPMGRALHTKLKAAHEAGNPPWTTPRSSRKRWRSRSSSANSRD